MSEHKISYEALRGLKRAYVAWCFEDDHVFLLRERLESWIEDVLEEAGMLEQIQPELKRRANELRVQQ